MAKKPYIYEDLEWLEIARQKSWFDPTDNPGDILPYSEFQKPYMNEKGKHSYPEWEWSFPPIGPIDYPTFQDPVPNPCSFDEDCVWAGIIGPDKMDCGDCFTWSQAHLYYGCDIAPWWAAFGSWELTGGDGECYLLFSGPVMATVCCPDGASSQTLTLSYMGPLGCSGSVEIDVSCEECCEEFTLTGAVTQATGTTWTGTISPACPCAECTVESNSGCTVTCSMNEAGSEVYVTAPACGNVTVTVTDECVGTECEANTASHVFNVTGDGGDWRFLSTNQAGCQTGDCSCGCNNDAFAPCIGQPYKYGTGADPFTGLNACRDNWYRQCKGHKDASCSGSNSGPPCSGDKSCAGGSHPTCGSCAANGGCCCANHSFWKCHWLCTCP